MMKEQLIEFETTKLAKEKGFSNGTRGCLTHYKTEQNHPYDGTKGPFGWEKNEIQIDDSFIVNGRKDLGDLSNEFYNCYELPTQSLLQKWLREKHEIYAYIDWHDCSFIIWDKKSDTVKTYFHQDLELGLQEALKLI